MAGVIFPLINTRLRGLTTNRVIQPSGGTNPVDTGPYTLANVRGDLDFTIVSGDNNYTTSFFISGGSGEFPGDRLTSWHIYNPSIVGATLTVVEAGRVYELETDASDAGGRVYRLTFFLPKSFGPTIQQTSVNTIGNNTLTVNIAKTLVAPGGY